MLSSESTYVDDVTGGRNRLNDPSESPAPPLAREQVILSGSLMAPAGSSCRCGGPTHLFARLLDQPADIAGRCGRRLDCRRQTVRRLGRGVGPGFVVSPGSPLTPPDARGPGSHVHPTGRTLRETSA